MFIAFVRWRVRCCNSFSRTHHGTSGFPRNFDSWKGVAYASIHQGTDRAERWGHRHLLQLARSRRYGAQDIQPAIVIPGKFAPTNIRQVRI